LLTNQPILAIHNNNNYYYSDFLNVKMTCFGASSGIFSIEM